MVDLDTGLLEFCWHALQDASPTASSEAVPALPQGDVTTPDTKTRRSQRLQVRLDAAENSKRFPKTISPRKWSRTHLPRRRHLGQVGGRRGGRQRV